MGCLENNAQSQWLLFQSELGWLLEAKRVYDWLRDGW